MALVVVASVKGSPGVSSTALALSAVWPRPVVLVEADPAGADLGFRCRAATGGTIAPHRGLLRLAASVRAGIHDQSAVSDQAQRLACGVDLVQGVSSAAQARGLASIWTAVADACAGADVDVIVDVGRLDRFSPTLPLAAAASVLVPVAAASLESVMHLADGLQDIVGGLARQGPPDVRPVLVGPEAHAERDRGDLDDLLTRAGLLAAPTQSVPWDPRGLVRLAAGEKATGRLGRTALLRATRRIATSLIQDALTPQIDAAATASVDPTRTPPPIPSPLLSTPVSSASHPDARAGGPSRGQSEGFSAGPPAGLPVGKWAR